MPEVVTTQQRWPDSLTIGTPGRSGEIKIYFNASDLSEAEKRVDNACQVRQRLLARLAGGD